MHLKKIATLPFILFGFINAPLHAANITGAGASFPAPIYAKWADAYQKTGGDKVNYQSIGSGAGIKQIQAKTVDFGASDMPLKDDELEKSGLVQFPTLIGGIVPVINLPQIAPGSLVLTGKVLGDIFLGKIKRWNDAELQKLNSNLKLPDIAIQVVRRSDASGTSFIFTNYLSKVNDEWKTKVGEGTTVNWPTGTGGKGNEGCAVFVQRLEGSIGYVEYAYVKQNKLNYAKLKNSAGNTITPTDDAFAVAAEGVNWNKSTYQILTNTAHKNAWPIAGATFILMHKVQDKPDHGVATLKFFDWAYRNGAKMADELGYVPLTPTLQNHIRSNWKQIKDSSGKSLQ